jgi:hypothetical protein
MRREPTETSGHAAHWVRAWVRLSNAGCVSPESHGEAPVVEVGAEPVKRSMPPATGCGSTQSPAIAAPIMNLKLSV